MLKAIEAVIDNHPKSVTSDFEDAFINAVSIVFPKTTIFGCFFHFKQICFRKIGNLGLIEGYMKDEQVRKILKLPQVLS